MFLTGICPGAREAVFVYVCLTIVWVPNPSRNRFAQRRHRRTSRPRCSSRNNREFGFRRRIAGLPLRCGLTAAGRSVPYWFWLRADLVRSSCLHTHTLHLCMYVFAHLTTTLRNRNLYRAPLRALSDWTVHTTGQIVPYLSMWRSLARAFVAFLLQAIGF